MKPRGLTTNETIEFYNALGAKQDKQSYYEDRALLELVRHSRFETAQFVVEFGCGTGRFAADLLTNYLPAHAEYWGCDISPNMITLSKAKLAPFEKRATLHCTGGDPQLPLRNRSADRFLSTYVFDILSKNEIHETLHEAKRILKKNGLLCLTGLTHGSTLFSKFWTATWKLRFSLNPRWVGGCRPIALLPFLADWDIQYYQVVVARGISSEVVVARKTSS